MKAEHEKALNSAISGSPGGPLMHVIAAKAVAFKEAAEPGVQALSEQVIANARVMARVLGEERGLRIVSGRTESHVFLVDLQSKNITGRKPKPPSAVPTSPSTKLDPQRSAEALRHLRHPHRLAGDDHPRFHRDRGRAHRAPHRRRARQAQRRSHHRKRARQGCRTLPQVPGVRRLSRHLAG